MAGRVHEKNPWAVQVFESYIRFCGQHGVRHAYQLAQDRLGFTSNQWAHLRTEETVLGDVELYANLYLLGIQEADPRTIPPRSLFMPQSGEYKDIRRAWTEEQWQEYCRGEKAQEIIKLAASITDGTSSGSHPIGDAQPAQVVAATAEAITIDSMVRGYLQEAIASVNVKYPFF